MKTTNEQEGTLPKNIDEIINASLETIDITALIAWLHYKKILIKVNNTGNYKLPNQAEIKNMIIFCIKQYYIDSVLEDGYLYGENIDNNIRPYIGGISLDKKDNYFIVDFDLYTPSIGKKAVTPRTFRNDANQITRLN